LEILEQTSPETYDFRLLPEFFEAKQKQRGQELWGEFLAWVRKDWAERCKRVPFAVEFAEFTIYPAVIGEDQTEVADYLHFTDPQKIDVVTSVPASDKKTIDKWRQEMFDAKSNVDEWFDKGNEITVLSLKEVNWRFRLYDRSRMDARSGEPLHEDILSFVTKQAEEHGGIRPVILYPQVGTTIKGILGKWVTPAYKIHLNPEFRQKLLKQLNSEEETETESTGSTESKEPPKKKFWKL
jgi:hypothetical protein